MKRFTFIILFISRGVAAAALLVGLLGNVVPVASSAASMQIDIAGPPGSGQFGARVVALPNGNIVVTDPSYDKGAITDVGAVYLYNGATRALISMLTGSTSGDQVGSGGVVMLENGNYVVLSYLWNNGAAAHAGAATWCDGTTGITGVVAVTNSLVGSQTDDFVGADGVTALAHGNYVVLSPYWDNGGTADAGAATWGNGAIGIAGVVSVTDSLVGSTADDQVGRFATALANGNYVVFSPDWDNGGVVDAGAATWGSGATGIAGVVSVTNSLVGSTADDQVGLAGVKPLANGNYVVRSLYWDNGGAANAGAATWANGMTGITGVVNAANSLVGSTAGDYIGEEVIALVNGNYVVYSGWWDNGVVVDAGAATWGDGTTGITGAVNVANSLVGSVTGDQVGWSATALANGSYVVLSPYWNKGAVADAGAATWGNGTTGITGVVGVTNSLVGSAANDQVGSGHVTALVNGNYVVRSPNWDNGSAADAGAATWGNGTAGTTGVVGVTNSLVGSTAGDKVGWLATALTNGNYVVNSFWWNNGGVWAAGAATWGNGTTGITGVVSVANSLVGSTTSDQIGYSGVTPLANGNYVVCSLWWNNGGVADAGAATWGNGTTGTTGVVSVTNSLVGEAAGDQVGSSSVMALANGHYVVFSPHWDKDGVTDAGSVTWGNGTTGVTGTVTVENSVRGATAGGGPAMVFAYDYTNDQLVVGRPADNIVTLFRPHSYGIFLPLVLRNAP